MNKQEFNKLIDKSNTFLLVDDMYYMGVCDAINDVVLFSGILYDTDCEGIIIADFADLTTNTSQNVYWFGERNVENYQTRQNALELFRQYVLSEKLYKKY